MTTESDDCAYLRKVGLCCRDPKALVAHITEIIYDVAAGRGRGSSHTPENGNQDVTKSEGLRC